MAKCELRELRHRQAVKEPIWIVKPPNSSCGRGIYLTTKLSDIPHDKSCVVSRYISNPYLINRRKFDLRIYVCVTSFVPLRIYLLDDGLARFATKDFNLNKKDLKKRYIHLTNFSVNKKNAEFEKNTAAESTDAGSKWSFKALLKHLEKTGTCAPSVVIDRISDVIIKTILAVEANMTSAQLRLGCPVNSCFEMFGYDILLDSDIRPWIMEVNCFPSLSSSSPMDKDIKTRLMCDVFHLVGIEAVDVKDYLKGDKKDEDEKAKRRWMGLEKDFKEASKEEHAAAHGAGFLSLSDLQRFFGIGTTSAHVRAKAEVFCV
jgi:tubulin polyglutamylase TTLL4